MAYDAARARVVLFGGVDPAGTALADTWEWDGSDWTKRTPAASPPARMSHALAFDLIRAKVVLFGGTVYPATFFADTWEWDGTTWRRIGL